MSPNASQWAAAERVRQAEYERYGDGQVKYDASFRRYRSIQAIEDPHYNITEQTLPSDRSRSRILHIIEKALEADADIKQHTQDLNGIVVSEDPGLWYNKYCEVVAMILSAAKAVDGSDENLAELVTELACCCDLTNPSTVDLKYEIGDFWVRTVEVRSGMTLIGEGNLKIWSEMPNLQLWIREDLEKFPQRDRPSPNIWPDDSWRNFTKFCWRLSRMHAQGSSPVSSLDAAHGIQVMQCIVNWTNLQADRLMLAAIYIDLFGEEIYKLCKHETRSYIPESERLSRGGSQVSYSSRVSLDDWALWVDAFRDWIAASVDPVSKKLAARAVEQMVNIQSSS